MVRVKEDKDKKAGVRGWGKEGGCEDEGQERGSKKDEGKSEQGKKKWMRKMGVQESRGKREKYKIRRRLGERHKSKA